MNYIIRPLIIVTIALFFITTISCKRKKVESIYIGNKLYENLSYSENKILTTLIEETINGNVNALRKLIYFDCGDSSGCQGVDYIITKIIDKMGESKFSERLLNLIQMKF